MQRLKVLVVSLLLASVPSWGLIQAVTLYPKTRLLQSASTNAARIATLNKGTVLRVLARTTDGVFIKASVELETQGTLIGYVLTRDVEFSETASFAEPTTAKIQDPWSFAGEFGYDLIDSDPRFTFTAGIRYLWFEWTESFASIDFTVGQGAEAIGPHIGQRFYYPLNPYRPFVTVSYWLFDVRDIAESALEAGLGLQYSFSKSGFADLYATYLNNKIFNSPSGSTGYRFIGAVGLRF
jgi:hypothetical protein